MAPEDVRYGTIDRDYAKQLARTGPEEGPVWMVNLMSYRDRADYRGTAEAGATGREADDRYAPLDVLADIGAQVVFVADVEAQFLGGAPRWDRVGIVKYPSRRSFVEMQSRADFQERHVHKEAGMAATIVLGCVPTLTPSPPDPPDWSSVPHAPTEADGPIQILHVLRFAERSLMQGYQDVAGEVAVPHGVRPAAWFEVEGTIVGDGRSWDQVRFNAFPSRRAFEAVATDQLRRAAEASNRQPAIADTYTLLLRPTLDRLAASVAASA